MAFVAVTASAQIEPGFRMGVRINGGVSMLGGTCYEPNKPFLGYGASLLAEYNFNTALFLQSGAGIENLGMIYDLEKKDIFYVQIPVHMGYRFIMEKGAFFIQAGPTFGIGLGKGYEIHWFCAPPPGSDSSHCPPAEKFFDNEGKRFYLGLGSRFGLEIHKFQFSAGVNYGVLKATVDGGHYLTVNLGVAYMF